MTIIYYYIESVTWISPIIASLLSIVTLLLCIVSLILLHVYHLYSATLRTTVVWMYVCVCICVCVCVHIHMCIHVCAHACMYTLCVCLYINGYLTLAWEANTKLVISHWSGWHPSGTMCTHISFMRYDQSFYVVPVLPQEYFPVSTHSSCVVCRYPSLTG